VLLRWRQGLVNNTVFSAAWLFPWFPAKIGRPLACLLSHRESLLPDPLGLSACATAAPSGDGQTVSGARRPGIGILRVAKVTGIALAPLPYGRQQQEKTLYVITRHPYP
jgi:hypothetical protein